MDRRTDGQTDISTHRKHRPRGTMLCKCFSQKVFSPSPPSPSHHLEGTAHQAGHFMCPVEGFGLGQAFFLSQLLKQKASNSQLLKQNTKRRNSNCYKNIYFFTVPTCVTFPTFHTFHTLPTLPTFPTFPTCSTFIFLLFQIFILLLLFLLFLFSQIYNFSYFS